MRKEDMDYDIYCGIDIGKGTHFLVAFEPVGEKRIMSCPLVQDEAEIRDVLVKLSKLGKVLVTVDQPGCIGRLVVSVAQELGLDVAQIPPRTFKKAADTYGEAKSDARDAFVIADSSRTTPRMISPVKEHSEAMESVKALCSFRADAVKERTGCYNRLHDLLVKVSPPLEQLFSGQALHGDLALCMLARYGGPLGLKHAGRARVSKWAAGLKYQRTRGPRLVKKVFEALSKMTLVLPATAVIEDEIKRLAHRILELNALEGDLGAKIGLYAAIIPEVALLKSMPGMGDALAPAIVSEIGDISRFSDDDHLASYSGVAPVKKESGTSLKGGKKTKGGNRRLKNALVQYAKIACLHDLDAKAYYDKKRSQGKSHRQALLCLARCRIKVIYALLKTGSFYEALPKAA